ncbi:serine protease 27-like isoform X2 [Lineus longissimus]|uniref:serine protease 27-like isoform X2 n=1 Tax=Lineus longissimus TaxID=88925 RepID=UPI002B4E01FA
MRFLVIFVLCGLPIVLGWRGGRRIDWKWWEKLETKVLQPKLCYRRRGYCIFDWREGWCPEGYETRWNRQCGYYGVCCIFPPRPITAVPPTLITTSPPKVTEFECGVSKFGADAMKWRIVGGRDADHGEYPWQVSILYLGVHWCGGTLINRDWVMTAAHCFISKPARDFSIILGQHRLNDDDKTEQHIGISKIIDHPEYHFHDTEHDLSLVKLSHAGTYNDYVIPACLPGKEEVFEGMFCTVTGWGHTAENGLRSNVLKEVTVPVVTRDICAKRLESKGDVYGTNICAGYEDGGKDACQSDSGGPLNCRKFGENWMVAGVVSWGDGCGKAEKPGVYTSVAAYSEWIKETVAAN